MFNLKIVYVKSANFISVFLFLSFFFSNQLYSQTELTLNRVEGFSSSDRIADLMFEDNGKLWIASKAGVYSYTPSSKSRNNEIAVKNALAVKTDTNGDIYAGFQNNSIYANNDMIFKIQESSVQITDIEVYDRKIWVSSNDGIFVFSQDTKKLENHFTTRNSKLLSDDVSFVYSDSSGILWIGTGKGVIRVNKDRWSKCFEQDKRMLAITEYYDIVWLISDKEMWEIESAGNRWYPAALKNGLYKGEINDIVIDNDGHLFIASDVLIRFNPQSNLIEEYGKSLGLLSKKCLALEVDSENSVYIGTENAGLFKISTEEIQVDRLTAVAILENPITCPEGMDGSIVLEVTGGQEPLEYFWEPAYVQGTNPTNLKKGSYSVTIVDAFKNELVRSITIEEPSPLKVNVLSKSRISGPGKKDGSCQIEVTGGTAPYNVIWDNNQRKKGVNVTKLNYGIHIINVTDVNGCKTSSTVEIEKEKFIPDLDIANIKVGQTLRINNLFFKADSTQFDQKSEDVLLEVLDFMRQNPSVSIEIGGHTNNIPIEEYCDKLSTSRAENVADFLVSGGIEQNRIQHKGYGKRKPIASNESVSGRNRNQRVEIKILQINE